MVNVSPAAIEVRTERLMSRDALMLRLAASLIVSPALFERIALNWSPSIAPVTLCTLNVDVVTPE